MPLSLFTDGTNFNVIPAVRPATDTIEISHYHTIGMGTKKQGKETQVESFVAAALHFML